MNVFPLSELRKLNTIIQSAIYCKGYIDGEICTACSGESAFEDACAIETLLTFLLVKPDVVYSQYPVEIH